MDGAIVRRYLCDPTFSLFDTIPECDRHTDTRRRHNTALSIASCSKEWNPERNAVILATNQKLPVWPADQSQIVPVFHSVPFLISSFNLKDISIVYWKRHPSSQDLDHMITTTDTGYTRWYCSSENLFDSYKTEINRRSLKNITQTTQHLNERQRNTIKTFAPGPPAWPPGKTTVDWQLPSAETWRPQ